MKTWQAIFLGFLLGMLSSGVILLLSRSPSGVPVVLLPPPTLKPIMVYVSGEVNLPGVYALQVNSRVIDAVRAAADFTPDADKEAVNLAKAVEDGEKIIIPKIDQSALAQQPTRNKLQNENDVQFKLLLENPLDINSADANELQMLPDIGATKAEQIIEYRETYGYFQRIEDIQNVPGIGPQIFENIKSLIRTGD